jgi:HEPN domain-containing protein
MNNKARALDMIEMARSDIRASKSLYRDGIFLQSLFSLQQAVEKANKAIGIWAEYIDPDKTRDVGHDHLKIHSKVVDFNIYMVQTWQTKTLISFLYLQAFLKQMLSQRRNTRRCFRELGI